MEKFHDKLNIKIDEFVHLVYKITRNFPKDELYGATSQLRRAALSIMLNYVEGYARKRRLVKVNFFEISYGSTKESAYLLAFAFREGWFGEKDYQQFASLVEEIGAMLWRTIEHLSHDT